MEQGKDIVTIDPNGECCAYQLKTGDIDLVEWRKIRGEIQELIELSFAHPSVDKSKMHKAFLVTNGTLTDEVRLQIDQINRDNATYGRKWSYLDVIELPALLKEFIQAQGKFIPSDLEDFDLFLRLFLSDGRGFLPKEKFIGFLHNTLFADAAKCKKSDAINTVASSVIMTAYSLHPYQLSENYYAQFEAWTCLAASILRYVHRAGLEKDAWAPSHELVMSEIVRNLILLRDEAVDRRDFFEGSLQGDGGLVYRARATVVLGALAALENHRRATEDAHIVHSGVLNLMKNNTQLLLLWGESAFPFFYHILTYLEANGEEKIAQQLLSAILQGILNKNSPGSKDSLASPYYDVHEILELSYGIEKDELDFSQFAGSSYLLCPLIEMTARRNARGLLASNWRRISHILLREFKPDNIQDIFTWRSSSGTNYSSFPKPTQSWSELVTEARSLTELPILYSGNRSLWGFFILACPHRATKSIIRLLDQCP
jgi:hypothetical protein